MASMRLMPLLLLVLPVHCKVCPHKTPGYSGGPRFTVKAGSVDYVRKGSYYMYPCCGEGYDEILWYRWNSTKSSWDGYSPDGPGPYDTSLEEHGQVLSIKRASRTDGGTYRCELVGRHTEVERELTLHVVDCEVMTRGPVLMAPGPRNVTVDKLGDTAAFSCIGYFGCGQDFRTATWYVSNSNDDDWHPVKSLSQRYQMETFSRDSGTVLGANLTIRDIQVEDIGRKFMCLLATPQVVKGQTEVIVHVRVKDETSWTTSIDEASLSLVLGVGAGVCVLLILLVAMVTLLCHSRRQIRKQSCRFKSVPKSSPDAV